MKPDRRSALSAGLFALMGLAAAPKAKAARPDPDADLYRERCAESRRFAADYRLFLPPLWEVGFALSEAVEHHDGCGGGSCKSGLCLSARGMTTPMESFASLVQCDTPYDVQRAALEDRRRAAWHVFPGQDDLRVLAALEDLLAATDELLDRHAECSCRLCGDAEAWRWMVELFRDVIDCAADYYGAQEARAEADRRGEAPAAVAKSLGLA